MKKKIRIFCWLLILAFPGLLMGCSMGNTEQKETVSSREEHASRDNTPVVLVPSADGKKTIEKDVVTIDISNKNRGYIMAAYHGTAEQMNIQITGPNGVTYMYFITDTDTYIGMPLSAGDGAYTVDVYENIEGDIYSSVLSKEIEVKLEDEFLPFLYANQYVNFNRDTKAVKQGQKLAEGCADDIEVLTNIYNYVVENLTYDYEEAENVQALYLPDLDEVLETKKGICFDYAALMCAMLRTQRIPAKLQIGYTKGIYHAWISTYIKGQGWVDGIIQFDGKNWKLMDPTFASTEKGSEEIMDYINHPDNYEIMYER